MAEHIVIHRGTDTEWPHAILPDGRKVWIATDQPAIYGPGLYELLSEDLTHQYAADLIGYPEVRAELAVLADQTAVRPGRPRWWT